MGRKHTAIAALVALGTMLVACGDDGGSALSEDDFIDELNDLCSNVVGDLNDLDSPEVGDFGSLENFADDAVNLLEDAVNDLDSLNVPEGLSEDFDDFFAAAEDQLAAAQDLAEAAADEDEDAVNNALDDLQSSGDDVNDAADNLGADDCIDDSGTETTEPTDTTEVVETTDVVETTEETDPPETTEVVETTEETDPPETTDESVPDTSTDDSGPASSMPGNTGPSMSMPTGTAPIGSVSLLDVAGQFAAPAGYTFQSTSQDISGFVDEIAADPALGAVTAEVGAADVYDANGNFVAQFWVLFTSEDYNLAEDNEAGLFWLNLVAEGEESFSEYTTTAGFFGYLSDYGDGSVGFGTIVGPFGMAVFGAEGFDLDGIFDGFFVANGG